MRAKTGLRLLFYSFSLAIIIHYTWNQICFYKGALDAKLNLLTHRKIVRTFSSPLSGPGMKARWNGEMWDDTAWVADSLIFTKFGYMARECKLRKNPSFFAEESGQVHEESSVWYTHGYMSIYKPYLMKEVLPAAIAEAKSLLAKRPTNWKDDFSVEEKKARILFFK